MIYRVRANTLMLELEQARLKSTYLEYVTTLSKLLICLRLMTSVSWSWIWINAVISSK